MANEENRRGKLHHPVTDPPNHIQPLIYLFLVSSMYHHKEDPKKSMAFSQYERPVVSHKCLKRAIQTKIFLGGFVSMVFNVK